VAAAGKVAGGDLSQELPVDRRDEIGDLSRSFNHMVERLRDDRVSDVLERGLIAMPAEEKYIAETFCARAARRVERCLTQIENNDDERMHRIALATYARRGYAHSI
jgi:nitrogen fixation/metabolism regulation signal transduction histidine kinase